MFWKKCEGLKINFVKSTPDFIFKEFNYNDEKKKIFKTTSKYNEIPVFKNNTQGKVFLRSDTGFEDNFRILIFQSDTDTEWNKKC